MIPYPITDANTRDEQRYNTAHSRTRIKVECAFGSLKNRFRIFKSPLNQKTQKRQSHVIIACLVLHNILIDIGDGYASGTITHNNDSDDDGDATQHDELGSNSAEARLVRDTIKDYLAENR